jgi:hypothetical protein
VLIVHLTKACESGRGRASVAGLRYWPGEVSHQDREATPDNQGSHEKHDFSLSLSLARSPSSPHLVVSGFSIVPRRCTRTARYRGRKPAAHIVLKRARNLPVHFHPLGCRARSLLALSNYAIAVCTYTYTPPSPLQDVCIYIHTHTIFLALFLRSHTSRLYAPIRERFVLRVHYAQC